MKSVQTRCIVKGEAQKIHFSGDFLGAFDFLRVACSLNQFHKKTFKFTEIPDFYQHPL